MAIVRNNDDIGWEEVAAVKEKKGRKIDSDFDSSDSERHHETLSDWDIDVTESINANKWKSTVAYTAPPQKKKAPKPDPEEYDDEYYEEEEDEQLQEVDDDGEEMGPAPTLDTQVQSSA